MTKTELNRFQAALTAKAAELKDAIRNRDAIAIETNSDLMDQIQHAMERELALDRLDRESHLAREVQAAISRIESNLYGVCVECEEEIALKRLAAVPWTRSCIACQEIADGAAKQSTENEFANAE